MSRSAATLNLIKGVVFAVGLMIALSGLLAGIGYIIQLVLRWGDEPVDGLVVLASLAAFGLILGGIFAWQGLSALKDRVSPLFQPPPLLAFIVIYIPVLIVGQVMISLDLFPALTFPLFHIVAATIPSMAVLTYVHRRFVLTPLRWREIIIQLSGGAFLSTIVAFIAEIFIAILLLFITLIFAALTPSGSAYLQELSLNLNDPIWLENPNNLQELFTFPPVLITVALLFIVVAPITEEFTKLFGVMAMSYRRPSRTRIFVWGLASGAGFALFENLFNTAIGLDAWIFVMLLRIGGSVMHCLGAGLTALGWHEFLMTYRPWRLLRNYVIAVIIHAVWNGAVIIMAGSSIFALDGGELMAVVVGGVVVTMLVLLLILTIVLIAALVIITLRLRDEEGSAREVEKSESVEQTVALEPLEIGD